MFFATLILGLTFLAVLERKRHAPDMLPMRGAFLKNLDEGSLFQTKYLKSRFSQP